VSMRKFWTLFAGMFLGIGLIVLLVGLYATYRAYDDANRLAHEGQVTEGIVLEKKIENHHSAGGSRGDGTTHSYRVVYRFTTTDGQTIADGAKVDRATWDRLVERSPVSIVYVPGAPGTNALAGQEPEWVWVLIAPSSGLIFCAIGGFVLIRLRGPMSGALSQDDGVQSERRDHPHPRAASNRVKAVQQPALPPRIRRVLLLAGALCLLIPLIILGALSEIAYEDWRYARDGSAASCAVTGKSIEAADASRSTRYLAHCRFAAAAGQAVEADYALPVDRWDALTPGSALAITYLPADPQSSRLAEDGFSVAIAAVVLLFAFPVAAVFALFGGLFLQHGRRGSWELGLGAGLRPSAALATAALRLLRLGLVGIALLVYLFVSLWLTALLADTPAMQAVDRFVDVHRRWLLIPGIPLGLLGFVLFLGSGLAAALVEGKPLSREELDDFYRAQGRHDPTSPGLGWRWQMGIDDGTVIATREPIVAFTLADLKYARRAGLLRRPPFPRHLAHLAGALLLLLGVGSAIFAIGSGPMRIWVVLWVLLALGLIARALVKR